MFQPWILIILITFCPCIGGDFSQDDILPLHMMMPSEAHCKMNQEIIMHTIETYEEEYPNVKIDVLCRPDFPANANGFSYEVN